MSLATGCYFGLGVGASTFTELVGAGYARQGPVSLSIGKQALASATFTASGLWPPATQVGVFDASSAGDLLFWFFAAFGPPDPGGTPLVLPGATIGLDFSPFAPPPNYAAQTKASGLPIGRVYDGPPFGRLLIAGSSIVVSVAGALTGS